MVVRDGAESGGDLAPRVKIELSATVPRRKPVNGAAKGAKYERDLADYFVSLGYGNARRMIRTGTKKHADEGDIDGLPFTVQAKTQKADAGDAQIARWHAEMREQQSARRHLLGLLVVKRNGYGAIGKSWVHVDALSLARLTLPPALLSSSFALNRAAHDMITRVCLEELATILLIMYPPR